MIIIALAGGEGSRLWPYSKKEMPKQFLNFKDEDSCLMSSVKIYNTLVSLDKLFVVTNNKYKHLVEESLDQVSPIFRHQILVEPYNKNTLPAVAWAIRHLLITKKAKSSDTVLVVPTDHIISNADVLVNLIKSSEKFALENKIVAFGIAPKKAETGYGYIRISDSLGDHCYNVDSFIEKPKQALAEKFIQNEDWLWNIGLYLFKIDTFLKETEKYLHSVHQFLICESHHEDYIFKSLSSISFDEGLIEKTTKLVACKVEGLEWFDIGSWDSIYELYAKDENQNVKIGQVVDIDMKNCLVFSDKKVISTVGIEDLIIIETKDELLVAKKGESKKLKELLERMHNDENVII